MPTGYTSDVGDGKCTSFTEFAMRCARNFGALIEMRDDAMNKEIPYDLPISHYHEEELQKAIQHFEEVSKWDDAKFKEELEREQQESLKSYQESLERRAAIKKRYEDMLVEVQVWQVPTSEHEGLKKFMINQLTESIDFDCSYDSRKPVKPALNAYKKDKLERAQQDIDYHSKHWKEGQERNSGKNKWIRDLRGSLIEYDRQKQGIPARQPRRLEVK